MKEKTRTEEEETTSSESSTEENQEESTQSDGGENTQTEKDIPFHEHPRWKEREESWNRRLEDQERKFNEELNKLRPSQSNEEKIPEWFGGGKEEMREQWQAYQRDMERLVVSKAEERAFQRLQEQRAAEDKNIQAANAYFENSMKSIERISGEEVDRNALLQYVIDHKLVDSEGRWDYYAGFAEMKGQKPSPALNERQRLAAATTKESGRSEGQSRDYKTSKDFVNNRPW